MLIIDEKRWLQMQILQLLLRPVDYVYQQIDARELIMDQLPQMLLKLKLFEFYY
jgi:hypothetical protein